MLESITVITLLLSALIVWSMNRKVASSAFRLASRGMGRSKKKVALPLGCLAWGPRDLRGVATVGRGLRRLDRCGRLAGAEPNFFERRVIWHTLLPTDNRPTWLR